MPEATLRAFSDHGDVAAALDSDVAAAERTLASAAAAGVDLRAITAALECEGVRAFCDSYRELLACVGAKLKRTLSAVEPSW